MQIGRKGKREVKKRMIELREKKGREGKREIKRWLKW